MENENLIKLIKEISYEHPSRLMDFDVLMRGIEDEIDNGNINFQSHPEYPHLKIYKYSRNAVIERNWNIFTLISRGLILDTLNKKVIATPFVKFFNYDEIIKSSEFIIQDYTVYEKIDGCCHEDTILITEDGEKSIKEICDKKYNGKILSYNIYDNTMEFKEIEGYMISDDKKQWYEIEMEDGTTIKLTGNHKVYLPKLNCYRRVDELNGDEEFLMKK